MEIVKENLLEIKVSALEISEWDLEDILEFIDYIKLEFSEYFSDEYTNIGIYNLISPSNKYYVGQSIDIKNRHSKYKYLSCKDQPILYKALLKYGWDSFNAKILENIISTTEESKQLLNLLEFLYINYYKKLGECYNLSFGGDSNGKHHESTIEKLRLSKKSIKIDQYDLDGVFIKTFSSITYACKELNISSRSNIQQCIKGTRNKCNNFIFVLHGTKLNLLDKINKSLVAVDQYSKDGNFIKTWNSIKEASIELDISSTSISDCLNKRKKSAGNFYWVRSGNIFNITDFKKLTGKANVKEIIQLTMDNKFIREWSSVKQAADELNISRPAISSCLIGRTNSSSNYKWKYKNEYNN